MIPEGWEVKTLGSVLTLEYGKGLPSKNRTPGNYPVFGSNGEVGTHNKYLVEGPAIIVGRKGSIGKIIWASRDSWPIDTTYFVKTKPNQNLKYTYFLLLFLKLQKLNEATGVPGLSRIRAYSARIAFPPLPE